MAVPTGQNMIREYITLLLHRGVRHAAVDGNDIFKVRSVGTGVTVNEAVAAGKSWIIIEMDDAVITTLDEKAFSMDHPHVPDNTRL